MDLYIIFEVVLLKELTSISVGWMFTIFGLTSSLVSSGWALFYCKASPMTGSHKQLLS